VALVAAGCGGATAHRTTKSAPTAPPRVVTVKQTRPALTPGQARLRAALVRWLHRAGPGAGALVYDLSARATLFSQDADRAGPPASVEKLYTTVALLERLGPNARFATTLLGRGHLGPAGVWHGDLYLRGDGDPTFGDGAFNAVWTRGLGPTANQLVGQLGLKRVTGHVFGDPSRFDSRPGGPNTAYAPDVADLGGQLSALTFDHGAAPGGLSPAAFAARQLVATMHGAHIAARAAPATATAPPDARVLASVSSPPLSALVQLMDVNSDDFYAELLTKQLGARFGGAGSTPAGARVIAQTIAAEGIHPRIVDGSGLSRADQSSPGQVVALLRRIWHTDIGRMLTSSLAVVGVNGTVAGLARHTPAQGRCFAKTGTLDYVSNLAGYCAARGGHSLAFAFFLDGPPNQAAISWLGHLVSAVAAY
jgi:D-alanyl-D-alanine carboxypeptidase/D-alanyl-D-alanine-endopeptidase (penicillin-binding protein 4)